LTKILLEPVPTPRSVKPEIPEALESIVMKSLDRNPNTRYSSAEQMALAIESAVALATPSAVGRVVERLSGESLKDRNRRIAEIEGGSQLESGQNNVVQLELASVEESQRDVRTTSSHTIVEGRAAPPPKRSVLIALGVGALSLSVAGGWFLSHRTQGPNPSD